MTSNHPIENFQHHLISMMPVMLTIGGILLAIAIVVMFFDKLRTEKARALRSGVSREEIACVDFVKILMIAIMGSGAIGFGWLAISTESFIPAIAASGLATLIIRFVNGR